MVGLFTANPIGVGIGAVAGGYIGEEIGKKIWSGLMN